MCIAEDMDLFSALAVCVTLQHSVNIHTCIMLKEFPHYQDIDIQKMTSLNYFQMTVFIEKAGRLKLIKAAPSLTESCTGFWSLKQKIQQLPVLECVCVCVCVCERERERDEREKDRERDREDRQTDRHTHTQWVTPNRLTLFFKVVERLVLAIPADKFTKEQKPGTLIHSSTDKNFISSNTINSYIRNNDRCFVVHPCKTEQFRYSFFSKTVVEWNHLDNNIVHSASVKSFRTAISK